MKHLAKIGRWNVWMLTTVGKGMVWICSHDDFARYRIGNREEISGGCDRLRYPNIHDPNEPPGKNSWDFYTNPKRSFWGRSQLGVVEAVSLATQRAIELKLLDLQTESDAEVAIEIAQEIVSQALDI